MAGVNVPELAKRSKEKGGVASTGAGKEHDASGALAVEENMRKANIGGGTVDTSIPKPKRETYPSGLGGDAQYGKAYTEWQKKAIKHPAQKKALDKL